jgi:hypothetical protein
MAHIASETLIFFAVMMKWLLLLLLPSFLLL